MEQTAAEALTADEHNELKEIFNLFDKDNDGYLNAQELGMAMRALAQHPTEQNLLDFVTKPENEEGSGFVDFADFLNIMAKKMGETDPAEELSNAFKCLDPECTGQMGAAKLRHIVTSFGEKLTDEEAEEMIKEADDDGDGVINYEEFIQMLLAD